ncbi:copper amine oxidase [Thelonectria olida]|uniref:Copper amine oxidase n=1 Tax=Thelonectria olida TaxID=1576542 RepID=A0A9P8VT92_9HYPO|nr:copper amine oxidase [Thelonectria olida]
MQLFGFVIGTAFIRTAYAANYREVGCGAPLAYHEWQRHDTQNTHIKSISEIKVQLLFKHQKHSEHCDQTSDLVKEKRVHPVSEMYFRFPLLYPLLASLVPLAVDCQQIALDAPTTPSVSIEGEGRSYDDLNATVAQALNLCQVHSLLNSSRHRVLLSGFQSEPHGHAKTTDDMFEAAIYDYTGGRSILLSGVPFDPTTASIIEANIQPPVISEELAEAGRMAGARSDEIVTGGMPPFITYDFPNGTSHRILNIAIIGKSSSRLAHVNMNNGTVDFSQCPSEELLAFDHINPWHSQDQDNAGGTELWTLQAVRPAASSGHKGSGIELRHVKYKGKTVLYRAHVPILNVEYKPPLAAGCGPYYRDWQNEEYPLQCTGRNVAPGFRMCDSPAKTILDPPNRDGGDFGGVAVYVEGQEVVLKSQLRAGWYRYVSEWRFHVDGTLRPRFGFGAVYQPPFCVCQVHHHHVYWRLDFDIGTPGNNLVREFNKPPLFGSSNYHDKTYEIRRPKDASHQRHWEISNTRTGNAYSLIPGTNDGTSDSYGVGDIWVVRYHGNELDDGVSLVGGSASETKANIDMFLTGELVKDKDVVIWYGAHFKHDQAHEHGASHIVGPTIRPLRW